MCVCWLFVAVCLTNEHDDDDDDVFVFPGILGGISTKQQQCGWQVKLCDPSNTYHSERFSGEFLRKGVTQMCCLYFNQCLK